MKNLRSDGITRVIKAATTARTAMPIWQFWMMRRRGEASRGRAEKGPKLVGRFMEGILIEGTPLLSRWQKTRESRCKHTMRVSQRSLSWGWQLHRLRLRNNGMHIPAATDLRIPNLASSYTPLSRPLLGGGARLGRVPGTGARDTASVSRSLGGQHGVGGRRVKLSARDLVCGERG